METGKGADALERRPQLAAALSEARRLRCSVAVAKLDRLSRDVHFISGLMAHRVPFARGGSVVRQVSEQRPGARLGGGASPLWDIDHRKREPTCPKTPSIFSIGHRAEIPRRAHLAPPWPPPSPGGLCFEVPPIKNFTKFTGLNGGRPLANELDDLDKGWIMKFSYDECR